MGILRTNHRPDQLAINAIGGGIPKSSAWDGAGQFMPYGGFMFFSYSGTIMDQTAGVDANQSYAMVISTYAALSAFYGEGMYSYGFKFLPFGARVLSMGDTAISHGAQPSYHVIFGTMMNSGSIALIKVYGYSQGASVSVGWLATLATIAEIEAKLWVWGFIVSTP